MDLSFVGANLFGQLTQQIKDSFKIPNIPRKTLINPILDIHGGSDDKESACNAGDPGLIPELGRYPGEGKGTHSIFWPGDIVHGVAKSWTQLSDFQFHALLSFLNTR